MLCGDDDGRVRFRACWPMEGIKPVPARSAGGRVFGNLAGRDERGSAPAGGIDTRPCRYVIPAAALLIALGLHLVSRHTRYGKTLLAVVQNSDAARLVGPLL